MEATLTQTWNTGNTASRRWLVYLMPSLTDFAFILPIVLLFQFLGGTGRLLADGDTGWHIRTGDWILQHRAVPTVDLFSFTKQGQPWFAWEWGWDVLFSLVHSRWGLGGVAFVNVLVLGLVSALLFRLIRRVSNSDILSFLVTVVAMYSSAVHWLARPHLFSWIFILLFSHVIFSAQEGNRKSLLWLAPLMLFWVNLHGGFFVGILLLATTAIGEFASALSRQSGLRAAWRSAWPYTVSTLTCSFLTFVNPYGWQLHHHIFEYLGDSKLMDNIAEFQTLSFHSPGMRFFEAMLVLGLGAAYWCFTRSEFAASLSIVLWAHFALFSGRNIPIFVFMAAPWVARMCAETIEILDWGSRFAEIRSSIARACLEFRPLERIPRSYVSSVCAMLIVAVALLSGMPGFAREFNPENFPVKALTAIRNSKFNHLFTTDQWGDYLIYQFYPSQSVYVDGRSDFYGSKFFEGYQHILSAQFDWEQRLQQYRIDAVLVRPDAPVASVLKSSRNWKVLSDDGSAILFGANSVGKNFGICSNKQQVSTAPGRKKEGLEL